MVKRISIIAAIALSLLYVVVAQAQPQVQNVSYNKLSPDNGLSHITVNSLYQDENGAIWVATRDGLNRYDGSTVEVYRKDRTNPNSFASNNIARIDGDGDGTLFISCNEGVWSMDTAREEFAPIYYGQVDAICWSEQLYIAIDNQIVTWGGESNTIEPYFTHPDESVVILSMQLDSKGRMWIGTYLNGVFRIEPSGEVRNIIEGGNIPNIFEDMSGDMWFGSQQDGLYVVDGVNDKMRHFEHDPDDPNSIATNFVRDIAQDNQGNIWLATNRGLSRYTPHDDKFVRYRTSSMNSSLWSIMTDAQGSVWFGSYFGGVSWFNPEYSIFLRYNTIEEFRSKLGNTVIGRMVEDRDGVLWICTEGRGVFIYDRGAGEFHHVDVSGAEALFEDNVKSVYYDEHSGVMWFGTHLNGLYRYDIGTDMVSNYRYDPSNQWSIPSNVIRDIDMRDGLLILATPVGVATFDPATLRSERLLIDTPLGRRVSPVSNLDLDSRDRLWIGTEGQGLFRYDFGTKELVNYKYSDGKSGGVGSNNISTILEDHRGVIWIGHEGAGFDRYNSDQDNFTNYDSQSSGLVGNRVYEISDNLDNTLSVLTGEGFSLFDCESEISYNYSNKMGYTLLSPNENAMYRTRDGQIFIGGVDGLISLSVDKLVNIKRREYDIKFSTLYVNQQQIQPHDESQILFKIVANTTSIELPHSTSSFGVDFTTTNYIPEINEPIEFTLEGFDREWITARGEQITYTNIPAGSYTLRLRAASKSDYIEGATMQIKIKQVWYRSVFAWILYLILTSIVIYYLNRLYRQRVGLSTQLKYEQDRIVDIESQNRSKLQFFTNISHEFRTPLAVIIGQIELLLNSKQISGTSRHKVMNIYKSSNELNSLIGELLDFRKHEQGRLSLTIKEANLSEMLGELYDIYCEHIASRGVYFKLTTPDRDVVVNCDVVQLRKVITNLLSNAIKYTTEGDSIYLKLEQSGESVKIKVEDTGAGIPANDLQYIFDRFYQGENSMKSSMGGTGIGLSFAKSIVDLHGGTIVVDSYLDRGSWFVVSIPTTLEANVAESTDVIDPREVAESALDYTRLEEDEESPRSLLIGGGRAKGGYRVTMLVVEDDPMLLSMLVEIFSDHYSVITAEDGQRGLELAREHLPQIIVSDVMMPKVSGIELCRHLKADLETSHIPIVLLTARGAAEQALEGINCGADDYIIKPFSVKLMLARCNNLINNRILLQIKYSQQPEENTYKMATSSLDQSILERALEVIERHISDPDFDIKSFATEMAMSRTNLFNKIKAITALTPNDFIMTVRLKRAATMLRSNHEMQIVDIAESVGFNGSRYFSKRFKERFGVTPVAYRQGEDAKNGAAS